MGVETKLRILDELDRHSSGLHLRQLTKNVHGSFPNVRRFVQVLEKEGIVKTEQKANLLNITLKNSPQTLAHLKLVHTSKFLAFLIPQQNAIQEFLSKLPIKPLIVSVPKDSSQINLVFQKIENEKEIQALAKLISHQYQIKLSPILLEYNQLENNPEKVPNDSQTILLGIEYYYPLLWGKSHD
ncbi:MAG: hypothetical protein Q8Q31_02135 [Nanoarchaeota archaeon]|nr:hypothetical protein [Nanoarchaeota archaeon]